MDVEVRRLVSSGHSEAVAEVYAERTADCVCDESQISEVEDVRIADPSRGGAIRTIFAVRTAAEPTRNFAVVSNPPDGVNPA